MSREAQLRSFETEYAASTNVGLNVADKHDTKKAISLEKQPADITHRNIVSEIREDNPFAALVGLPEPERVQDTTMDRVRVALDRSDLKEAAKLLAEIQG